MRCSLYRMACTRLASRFKTAANASVSSRLATKPVCGIFRRFRPTTENSLQTDCSLKKMVKAVESQENGRVFVALPTAFH